MDDSRVTTIVDIVRFLNGSEHTSFVEQAPGREEAYLWIEETLQKFYYGRLNKNDRGRIKRYIQKMTGYSRSQITRLVTQFLTTGEIQVTKQKRHSFAHVYTKEDIALLAKTDALHDYPNGAALKKVLKRMVTEYKVMAFERIAHISVSHASYNNVRTNEQAV